MCRCPACRNEGCMSVLPEICPPSCHASPRQFRAFGSSNSHSAAVAAATADSEQLLRRWRPPRHHDGEEDAAKAFWPWPRPWSPWSHPATIWLVSEPASSGVSAAITQSAAPGGLPSSAGPSPASDPGPPASTTERPFSWRIQPTPPSPSKPFDTKVRTAVEQTPFCGWSAGREASGRPSRYPPRPTSRASSPPLLSWASRVDTGFACVDPDTGVTSKPFVLVIKG